MGACSRQLSTRQLGKLPHGALGQCRNGSVSRRHLASQIRRHKWTKLLEEIAVRNA